MHPFRYLSLILALSYLGGSTTERIKPSIIVETKTPIMKGALIDDYTNEALIIKLTPPSRMLKDALKTVDTSRTHAGTYVQLQKQFGCLERVYQSQYQNILETFQQMIATPYPMKTAEEAKKFDITNLSRVKRNPLRLDIAFLRLIRPDTRVGGKLTKNGRFIKTMKYIGYTATAGVFAYEMADIFGAYPDRRYDELTEQIRILYENRAKDLEVFDKVALVTMSLNEQIKDITSEFTQLISESESFSDLKIRGSHLLTNYLTQLTFFLMILLEGKLPTFLMSLDTQRDWMERKINTGLLPYIPSISPHLDIKLKAIDEIQGQLVVQVSVPLPDSRFQLLHYVQWEPKIWIEGKCYSSPAEYFYLAYPSSRASDPVITRPMLINPRSCLNNGFLMCESDSILEEIPDLKVNEICSVLPMINRKRRSVSEEITGPYYNLSGIIDRSLQKTQSSYYDTKEEIMSIRPQIVDLISENKKQQEHAARRLDEAKFQHRMYKIVFMGTVMITLLSISLIIWLIKKLLSRNNEVRKLLTNELIHLKLRET